MPTGKEILEALSHRLPKRGCPACGGKTWDIKPDFFISSVYLPDTKTIDVERGAPLVTAICTNCGFFLNYGAVRLGLINPSEQS